MKYIPVANKDDALHTDILILPALVALTIFMCLIFIGYFISPCLSLGKNVIKNEPKLKRYSNATKTPFCLKETNGYQVLKIMDFLLFNAITD